MKNSKVRAATLSDHTSQVNINDLAIEPDTATTKKIVALQKRVGRTFSKLSDEIAQSDHWMRNEPIPFGLDLFPNEQWFMRYCDLFYPLAVGGPIYMDTPGNSTDVMYCEQKLLGYRSKGVRYTYLKANEDASGALMRLDPVLPKGAAL